MLVGGAAVPKDSLRIEAYGTVDELNAFLGLWRDELFVEDKESFQDLVSGILVIQNEMHDLGGELATPQPLLNVDKQQVVTTSSIRRLEAEIDSMNELLSPLANFVLPGGHRLNSLAHICRTICRRAERCIVALGHDETIRSEVTTYVNRLSDWLFVAGRVVGKRLNIQEVLWKQRGKD
jgi:cob(I)alamin adenosyltransferase